MQSPLHCWNNKKEIKYTEPTKSVFLFNANIKCSYNFDDISDKGVTTFVN